MDSPTINSPLRTQECDIQHQPHSHSGTYRNSYYESRHNQPVASVNHSYDVNMCITAARFSDTYNTRAEITLDAGVKNIMPLSTTACHRHHSDEELLDYSNIILLHEAAQEIGAEAAQEIGAESIVSNCEALEETSDVPVNTLQTEQMQGPEVSLAPMNYQYTHLEHAVLSHESVHSTQSQVAAFLVHRSQNGRLYQQNYLENSRQRTDEGTEDFGQAQSSQQIDVNSIFAPYVSAEPPSTGQNYELPTQYGDAFQHVAHDENSVELIARYAADLANVRTQSEHYNEVSIDRQLGLTPEDKQRLLLESTMSPLLAAVHDITKRDAELQLYLNQTLRKESTDRMDKFNKTVDNRNSPDITFDDDDDGDYLLVSDKTVECRAKSTLPTNYLYFGDDDNNKNEPSVFAKKSIPRRTMFGPYEGQVIFAGGNDLDVLHVQTSRCYPVLLIDESHILDVSNEETSNWMRYVRLAEKYAQQNLHLLLKNGKIYLRCVRGIQPKEELRVGYHSAYAVRFMLYTLQPTAEDLRADFIRRYPWKCFTCERRFATSGQMKTHLSEHDADETEAEDTRIADRRTKSTKRKYKLRSVLKRKCKAKSKAACERRSASPATSERKNICRLCRAVFTRNEMLIQHMGSEHQKQGKENLIFKQNVRKTEGPDSIKNMYKCNLCAKRFRKEALLRKHKKAHGDTLSKPYKCSLCQQECATPAALTAHVNGHAATQYSCVFCEQRFTYVREFKKHVQMHKTVSGNDGYYECQYCKKHYVDYHLVRKHVRIFHTNGEAICYTCGRKFQNSSALQRHRLTHTPNKKYACSKCDSKFGRKYHLLSHMNRKHNDKKDSSVNFAENSTTLKTDNGMYLVTQSKENSGPAESNFLTKSDSLDGNIQSTKMSPGKSKPVPATSSSSSNRRKQTPTKLKAFELNAETVTLVALPELFSPFIISPETGNLSKDQQKQTESNENVPPTETECSLNDEKQEQYEVENTLLAKQEDPVTSNAANPLYPFRCHMCTHATFKRRGMLVNHLAKLHPSVNVEQVPILNAPIIRQQLVFPCPYCSNVYKLNAKRKMHIIKHHPGQELPASMRQSRAKAKEVTKPPSDVTTTPPTEVVASVGTVALSVHKCDHCYKQYAARSRLLNHYRKSHPQHACPPAVPQSLQQQRDSNKFVDEQFDEQQHRVLEPEIDILPYQLHPPASPENKLLKLSSAAALELSRFDDDFFNERTRDNGGEEVVEGEPHVFSDNATHADLQHLPALFEESSISGIDVNMDKYTASIEAQFFEKIAKLS